MTIFVAIEVALTVVGSLAVLYARIKDIRNSFWTSLLVYNFYWIGGLALGHLFVGACLQMVDINVHDPLDTALFFSMCAIWGNLLTHLSSLLKKR